MVDRQGGCGRKNFPQALEYRLPTDEEWSWAVGLPPELGATPAEKHQKNRVDFPWGKDYPPTKKVGNYADEMFRRKFPFHADGKDDWMQEPMDRGLHGWVRDDLAGRGFPGQCLWAV